MNLPIFEQRHLKDVLRYLCWRIAASSSYPSGDKNRRSELPACSSCRNGIQGKYLQWVVHTRLYSTRLTCIYKFGHNTTRDSLATSANNGCPICQTVWNRLCSHEQESFHTADSREGEVSPAETPALAFVTTAELGHWAMPNTFSLAIRYNPVFVGYDKWNMFILEPDESKSCHSRTHLR